MITSGISQGHLCVKLSKLVTLMLLSFRALILLTWMAKFSVVTEIYVNNIFSPGKFSVLSSLESDSSSC